VFKVSKDLNRLLKRDLKWAGIPYRDQHGRTVDVHALRHTTATYLGRAKVAPNAVQTFMRHDDLKLTMQTYTDPRLVGGGQGARSLAGDAGRASRVSGGPFLNVVQGPLLI
jgi:integrase